MNVTTRYWDNPPQSGRTATEILVKAVLMAAASIIAARYLATLRKQPFHVMSYQVLATVLAPTFPLADVFISTYRTLKASQRTGWGNYRRYHLCAGLDMRAVAMEAGNATSKQKSLESGSTGINENFEQVSVPLHLIPYQSLEPHRISYGFRWCAQMLPLIIFAFYAFVTDLLWMRRAHYGARTFLDDFTALTAFGGLINAVLGICILTQNTEWQAPRSYAIKFEKHCAEPSPADLFLNIAWRTLLPELQLSLVLGVFLQSLMFFLSRSGFVADISHGASCKKWYKDGSKEKKVLIPTSTGLELTMREPRPCHPWNEGGITNTVAILAETGYMLAYISSMAPMGFIVGYLLQLLGSKIESLSRTGRNLLWGHFGMVNSAGGFYLLLGYGLTCIAVWDITSPREWEPWMWKDPWASGDWIFSLLEPIK